MPRPLLVLSVMIGMLASPALADPVAWRAAGWKTDFSKATVPLEEILPGGPPRDGIPPIDAPKFTPAAEAKKRYGEREPVIELLETDTPRAYPLSVLTWHEIVNDTVDGRPVAVTYCPLCNASVVFDRRLDGRVLDFGTTGMLRNSDLVMYDRQTESWWQQFTGEAIVGALSGKRLTMLPSRVAAFADFVSRHPQGEVLVPTYPSMRPYGRNPYVGYDSRSGPYPLFQGQLPKGIDAMARVVVVRRGEDIVAVSLTHLRQQRQLTVDGVRLTWRDGVASALDRDRIADSRDVGAVDAVEAASGKSLVHDVTFAFVLFAFHPDVPLLTEGGTLRLTARQ